MTCKLARRKKKQIDDIIRKYKYYDYFSEGYKDIRSLTNQNEKYIMLNQYKFNSYTAYDEVDYLLRKRANINNINHDTRLIVPRYDSSRVKRSRLKHILVGYVSLKIDEYNEQTNQTFNPVSLYFKINSRKEDKNAKPN